MRIIGGIMLNLFSRLSLRANIVAAAMACLLLVLVACGDDDSSFAPRDSEDSSSSICENSSSSRHCEDCKDEAISSNKDDVKSSSSRHCEDCKDDAISSGSSAMSSSSVTLQSSSSETSVSSSSSVENQRESCDDENCLMDTRDGQTYKTVKIGEQTWMAENLNYTTVNSWCGGGSDKNEGDCTRFGRLYTWAAVIDSVKLATDADNPQDCGYFKACALPAKVQGVCPPGWHVPDKKEWNKLITAVGGESTAGKILKSQTGWIGNGNGTDSFGFSALPAGNWGYLGNFNEEGYAAYFWSATENHSDYAYDIALDYSLEDAYLDYSLKHYAYSVRCLKDDP